MTDQYQELAIVAAASFANRLIDLRQAVGLMRTGRTAGWGPEQRWATESRQRPHVPHPLIPSSPHLVLPHHRPRRARAGPLDPAARGAGARREQRGVAVQRPAATARARPGVGDDGRRHHRERHAVARPCACRLEAKRLYRAAADRRRSADGLAARPALRPTSRPIASATIKSCRPSRRRSVASVTDAFRAAFSAFVHPGRNHERPGSLAGERHRRRTGHTWHAGAYLVGAAAAIVGAVLVREAIAREQPGPRAGRLARART